MPVARRRFLSAAAGMLAASHRVEAAAQPRVQGPGRTTLAHLLPPGAESHFVAANGIKLHYVVAGTGPAVVLLHGWPETWFAWAGTIRALSDRFTVIAPDLRGTGLSERTASGYDKLTIASDISDLIGQTTGGRAHVIAHDMGGKAAYVLARMHPERIDKLVLLDCLIPGTENTDALHGGAWHYGFHMAKVIPELLTAGREREYIGAQIRAWSHRKDAVSEEAIAEYAKQYAAPGRMTAGFNYYRTLPDDARLIASLPRRKLAMPVLTIGGRYGVGTKLSDTLRPEADTLTALVAEDSGHFIPAEVPELFYASVRRFLLG